MSVLSSLRLPGRRLPRGRRGSGHPAPPVLRRVRQRFTTVEEAVLAVVKRSGVTEPFSREKVVARRRAGPARGGRSTRTRSRCSPTGSRRRCGPPGAAEVPSHEVGLAILGPLRELDEVAYLRFASVYRSFSSVDDFEKEIADLRRPGGGGDSGPPA